MSMANVKRVLEYLTDSSTSGAFLKISSYPKSSNWNHRFYTTKNISTIQAYAAAVTIQKNMM